MAKIVIIGAGFAGNTAALYAKSKLGKNHEVTVINKFDYFSYVPSWVWVAVNRMKPEKTIFSLKDVYRKKKINFVHGTVTEVLVDDRQVKASPADGSGEQVIDYDYLIVATGPHLNFDGTPGLGPDKGYTNSLCTYDHAQITRDNYLKAIERMKNGEDLRFVIGTGHPGATCQGAAFEYITNVHKDLVRRKIRDKATLVWLSNEGTAGDFGVHGISMRRKGRVITSEDFIGAVFKEYGIEHEVQKGVTKVDQKKIYWEDYEGKKGEMAYDFSMLIPQFTGVKMKFTGKGGEDKSGEIANPAGFIKVDAKYGLPYDELEQDPEAWPGTYQNPTYPEIFAAGIAFAPPGPISRPHTNPNGMKIAAAPPRTGMVSGIIGRIVALNVVDLINKGKMTHHERMTEMVAACIASMGDSLWDGSAATMVLYPVVPDFKKFPNSDGRDPFVTHMEMGLSSAWMKRLIHSTMVYKQKGKFGWSIIPE